jgi:hypothetical protein
VLFVGNDTQLNDIDGIERDNEFVNTLEDNFIQRGAPHNLFCHSAQVFVNNNIQDVLQTLFIKSWQSKPYQQHQNAAERRYQTIKSASNRLLNSTGAPSYMWLLCINYLLYKLNHTYNDKNNGVTLNQITQINVYISFLLRFHLWQKA